MREVLSTKRAVIAALLGLVGSVLAWVLVPYNNFVLKNTYLADNYLPEVVVGFLMLLVLLVNPLLGLRNRRWMLNRHQIALITGMMLFAAIIPSNGLMRMFPRMVAQMSRDMNANLTTSQIAAETDLRQSLFPDPVPTLDEEGNVVRHQTPVSDQFLEELYEGEEIPWGDWLVPMASWGMLLLALWAMMIGLGGVVYPQWRHNERLPFPLLHVYHAFIGDETDAEHKRLLPGIFYSRAFWIGCGVVFGIHLLRGLHEFTGAFPSIPLRWEMRQYYTDNILRYAPQAFNWQVIFFSVVGVAYFIPSRYAISIWGWVFGYSWYLTLGKAYIPAFQVGQVVDQSFGVLLAIVGWVLFLGRAHWCKVGKAMFGKAGSDAEARRNSFAGWMFVLGCAGIVFWLHWAGCPLWWSVVAMLGCAMVALLMARIIAETGLPSLWVGRFSIAHITGFFPLTWLSPTILLFTNVFYALITRATAVSVSVMTTLALGADREAGPKHQRRLLVGGLVVLLMGFVVCGAVHIFMHYENFAVSTTAKMSSTAMNEWARVDRVDFQFWDSGRMHQVIGVGMGSGLLWLCSRFPAWPIHPVGIILARISIGSLLWFSVFLGWLLKTFITRLFGGGVYRKARPLFLGLIIGELLAIITWTLVPVGIVLLTGADPETVPRYILMQYP